MGHQDLLTGAPASTKLTPCAFHTAKFIAFSVTLI